MKELLKEIREARAAGLSSERQYLFVVYCVLDYIHVKTTELHEEVEEMKTELFKITGG